MKFRDLIAFLFVLVAPMFVFANKSRLSPAAKLWLSSQSSSSRQTQMDRVEAFVAFSSPAALENLERTGVKVNAVFNGFATVSLPADIVTEVSDIDGLTMIDIPHSVHLLTDSASSSTHACMVNSGSGLPHTFTGKGVVIGVVDVGVDFNHRAFLDASLASRIKRVYMPQDDSGKPVEGLPGSEFEGDDILRLRCDVNSSHGTHTMGIAGGSVVNSYRGMAPDADLVVCALGAELSEVNVVNGVKYIVQYATSAGKPCVVNLSLGNHDGPHDGNGFMARAFEEIARSNPHVVIVVAAGNEAGAQMYMHKNISQGQPLSTILGNSAAEVDAWGDRSRPLYMKLHIYDSNSQSLVYTSDTIKSDTTITCKNLLPHGDIASSGQISIAFGTNDVTGNSRIYMKSAMALNGAYKIGVSYVSNFAQDVRVWECSGASDFRSCGLSGFTDGTDECSISDMATGDGTISVGAYVNRNSHRAYTGAYFRDTYAPIGSVSSFSSYGIDANGNSHPFVIAPGTAVISSVNSYVGAQSSYAMAEPDAQGRTCYWGVMSGTSMAAPCVAGIVALWQEANPNLTFEQVKTVMKTSADTEGLQEPSGRWGKGKIDAYQGLMQVLSSGLDEHGVKSSDLTITQCDGSVTAVSASSCPLQLTVYTIDGREKAYMRGDNKVEIDISQFTRGVYIVKAIGRNGTEMMKILKK